MKTYYCPYCRKEKDLAEDDCCGAVVFCPQCRNDITDSPVTGDKIAGVLLLYCLPLIYCAFQLFCFGLRLRWDRYYDISTWEWITWGCGCLAVAGLGRYWYVKYRMIRSPMLIALGCVGLVTVFSLLSFCI